jgi:hypothetical protein
MSDAFDPYYTWLSIPPEEQPPNHYRLLGVKLLETNADVIANAADRQMMCVRSYQSGKHSSASQQLLNELSTARICLLSPDRKTAYDQALRTQLAAATPQTAPSQPGPALPVGRAVPVAPSTSAARSVPMGTPALTSKPIPSGQPAPRQPDAEQLLALGFDPQPGGRASRPRPKQQAGGQPLTWAAAAVGLVVAVGLAWLVFGRNSLPPPGEAPSSAAPSAAAVASNVSSSDRARPDAEKHVADPSPETAAKEPDEPSPITETTDSEVTPEVVATANDLTHSSPGLPQRSRFIGEILWCGEIGADPGIPDEPQLVGEVSPGGQRGQIVGRSTHPQDTVDLQGQKCGWFGKALVWEAPLKDLAAGIKFAYGAPRVEEKVEYRLMIYPAHNPAGHLCRYDLRGPRAEIQIASLGGGQSRAGVLLDGVGQEATLSGADSLLVRIALVVIMRAAGVAGDLQFEFVPASDRVASVPQSAADRFLSTLIPRDVHVHSGLYFTRGVLGGILSQHSLCTHPLADKDPARVVYDIPSGYRTFRGWVGISDSLAVSSGGAASPVIFRILADGQTLWTSRPHQRRGEAEVFAVSLQGVRQLELQAACSGSDGAAWAVWFEPRLSMSTAPPDTSPPPPASGPEVFLCQLKVEDVQAFPSTSVYGQRVWFDGVESPHGLFTHPMSGGHFHATFHLPAPYHQLVGRVGLADDIGSERPWSTQTFRVLGDGRELWHSQPIRSRADSQPLDVDIHGVRKLELVVDCPDSDRFAHDVWIEPKLIGGPPSGRTDRLRAAE